jgi:hypothetical protein
MTAMKKLFIIALLLSLVVGLGFSQATAAKDLPANPVSNSLTAMADGIKADCLMICQKKAFDYQDYKRLNVKVVEFNRFLDKAFTDESVKPWFEENSKSVYLSKVLAVALSNYYGSRLFSFTDTGGFLASFFKSEFGTAVNVKTEPDTFHRVLLASGILVLAYLCLAFLRASLIRSMFWW